MEKQNSISINKDLFGLSNDGQEVYLYTLVNSNGISISISNYGGIIKSILTPDKNNNIGNIVIGFNNLEDYLKPNPHIGGIIGRYANRIRLGKLSIDNKVFYLTKNKGENHIHGGNDGFDRKIWTVKEYIKLETSVGISLNYISKDLEEGFPGNLSVTVTYTLNEENEFTINYFAETDKDTHINLTNHSYFNLSAGEIPDILDHEIKLDADRYVVVDKETLPIGLLGEVKNTELDFTSSRKIGQTETFSGYDYCYVLNDTSMNTPVATVYEPNSKRVMEVFSNQPGIQFYTGNFLDGSLIGSNGKSIDKYSGLCLETQHFPDSPNNESFPSTLLKAGCKYDYKTIFKFSVRK